MRRRNGALGARETGGLLRAIARTIARTIARSARGVATEEATAGTIVLRRALGSDDRVGHPREVVCVAGARLDVEHWRRVRAARVGGGSPRPDAP